MVTRESLPKKLIAKVEEDSAFRGRFITNPGSVLKVVFGIEVPEDANEFADEDDARMAHLVLPRICRADSRAAGTGGRWRFL